MLVKFVKYEGAGNDFILIDDRGEVFRPGARRIAALCDRHFGIGADGLMTLRRSAELDCSMRYYNADGSAGEMCGNGARCICRYGYETGLSGPTVASRSSPNIWASAGKPNISTRRTGCIRHTSGVRRAPRAKSSWA